MCGLALTKKAEGESARWSQQEERSGWPAMPDS